MHFIIHIRLVSLSGYDSRKHIFICIAAVCIYIIYTNGESKDPTAVIIVTNAMHRATKLDLHVYK